MEVKVARKVIREYVASGDAIDITNISLDDASKLTANEGWLDTELYSMGTYGCNGILFRGHKTGNRYAICARTQSLFYF